MDFDINYLFYKIGWALRDTGKKGIKNSDAAYKDDILTPPGAQKNKFKELRK